MERKVTYNEIVFIRLIVEILLVRDIIFKIHEQFIPTHKDDSTVINDSNLLMMHYQMWILLE